jgi:protoporphyrinogen oxidase
LTIQHKIIVIGAGPAGLTAAHQLAKAGCDVTLFEAGNDVGGLARSFDLWGQRVDCGPHRFFSSDKIVNDFFAEIVQSDYTLVNRLTRIYYRNKFFYYPLQPFNALSNLPITTVFGILFSYAKQRLTPIANPQTFEEWVINRFGKKLFGIFFKNYSEKLWGIPCSKIDADWAAQRIKKLSLWEAVKGALIGNKGNKHKTLVDQFAYPKNGTGMLYESMAEQYKNYGGKLYLNAAVKKIIQDENGEVRGVELQNGETHLADKVISTMPLTNMVKGLQYASALVKQASEKLYFRNTILVYVEIDNANLFPDNWIYVHSPEVLHGRITNFRNWCPSLYRDKKTSILCLEYWCFEHDEIWKSSEVEMGKLAEVELRKLNLISAKDKVLNTHLLHIPKCYPVYETGYAKHVDVVKNYLETIPNLLVIGRYGAFKYNNQDHSILMGLLAAKQIVLGNNQHLWNINTDDEYQEQGNVEYDIAINKSI